MQDAKTVATNVSIVISILFSIGGAFNVGMTGFWMAVPFMIFLGFLTFKKSRTIFVSSLVFILMCITINLTIYKNSFVFPVLKKGVQIEVVNDSLYRKYSDRSGSFIKPNDVYINEPTKEQKDALNNFLNSEDSLSIETSESAIVMQDNKQVIFKLKKGQKIDISGVYNFGGIDSINMNYLITEFGNMSDEEIKKGNILITPTAPVQSLWSEYLGDLMYFSPIFPIIIIVYSIIM